MLPISSAPARRPIATLGLAVALALVPAAAAQAAKPAKDAEYAGRTSQGEAISFVTSSDGSVVLDVWTDLTYRCTGEHDGQAGSFVLPAVEVRGSRFRATQTLRGTSSESVVAGGSGTVKGTFKRKGRRARGSLRSRLELAGGEICDSGRVAFDVKLR